MCMACSACCVHVSASFPMGIMKYCVPLLHFMHAIPGLGTWEIFKCRDIEPETLQLYSHLQAALLLS